MLIADQVKGPIDLIHDLPDVRLVVCVGNPRNYFARAAHRRAARAARSPVRDVVHPCAQVSRSSTVGAGSVLLAGAVLTADATISRHVAVMPHVVVTHDVVVRDYATLASGVKLGGGVVVDEGAYLGAGAMVREGVQHRRLVAGRHGLRRAPGRAGVRGVGRAIRPANCGTSCVRSP